MEREKNRSVEGEVWTRLGAGGTWDVFPRSEQCVQFSAEGVRSPQGRRCGTAGPGIGHGRTTVVDVATQRQDRRNSM